MGYKAEGKWMLALLAWMVDVVRIYACSPRKQQWLTKFEELAQAEIEERLEHFYGMMTTPDMSWLIDALPRLVLMGQPIKWHAYWETVLKAMIAPKGYPKNFNASKFESIRALMLAWMAHDNVDRKYSGGEEDRDTRAYVQMFGQRMDNRPRLDLTQLCEEAYPRLHLFFGEYGYSFFRLLHIALFQRAPIIRRRKANEQVRGRKFYTVKMLQMQAEFLYAHNEAWPQNEQADESYSERSAEATMSARNSGYDRAEPMDSPKHLPSSKVAGSIASFKHEVWHRETFGYSHVTQKNARKSRDQFLDNIRGKNAVADAMRGNSPNIDDLF